MQHAPPVSHSGLYTEGRIAQSSGPLPGALDSGRQQHFPEDGHAHRVTATVSRTIRIRAAPWFPIPPAPHEPAPTQGGLGDSWPTLCRTEGLRQRTKGPS